jgi:glycosyltransferase involved in cell wall biosynthesis
MTFLQEGVNYKLGTLSGEGPWCDWVRSNGYEPLIFGRKCSEKGLMFAAFWRLICYLIQYPVDVIYVCGARASFILRLLKIFFPEKKLVVGVRWNPNTESQLDRFFRLMERFSHPLVDAWITNSKIAKTTLVSLCQINPKRVSVVYNGLNTIPSDPIALEERTMEVLTVANLNPRKGHLEYLATVKDVVKVIPNVKFVFVGRDDMGGKIQTAIKESALSDHVSYVGFQRDISKWLRRARLMVLPSLWGEGCPTSIMEGFSYGLPIVAYAIDGIPELINNNLDGRLITPGLSHKLTDAILDILQNPANGEEMGNAGREKVLKTFSLVQCAKRHVQILKCIFH